MRKFIFILLLCLTAPASYAQTAATADPTRPVSPAPLAKPYFDAKYLDLTHFIAPPTAQDSSETKAEITELLILQKNRTPEQVKAAQDDMIEDVWRFSNAVNDPRFKKENLPKLAALFDRILSTEFSTVTPAKDYYKRLRPHKMSPLIKPVVTLTDTYAYPSGHSTNGTAMGILLANMIPEKRAEILARAYDFGHSRMIGGIHFPSDVAAGRVTGALIANVLMARKDFMKDFEPARKELRKVLALR